MLYVGNFTDAMKAYVEDKIGKLKKFTDTDDTTVKVGKKNSKNILRLEISCNGVRATSNGEDFYHLVNECVDKILSQVKRYKKTMTNKSRNNKIEAYSIDIDDNETEYAKEIVREKFLNPDTLTDEEAIEEMEVLNHNFYVYYSVDRQRTCVIYKRSEPGTYGVIVLN